MVLLMFVTSLRQIQLIENCTHFKVEILLLRAKFRLHSAGFSERIFSKAVWEFLENPFERRLHSAPDFLNAV